MNPDQVENTAAAFFEVDDLPPDVITPERPILDQYRRALFGPQALVPRTAGGW
ncbi:hypothetical protein [Streptomyces sp. SID10815]|uniref:hypothetical protein n=1 Tax=Streptomyces sp. SID10815 TaxID=2706027 RepID=UPI0013CCA70C|nr:hypothetical protein [Streptomyces sp. SID10815]NEA46099.1 hypothetical protein [Streptomyces sp. SID10815]